ncbi:MAG: hypothetical protein AAF657_25520 [Acidobacteriota bacterium]
MYKAPIQRFKAARHLASLVRADGQMIAEALEPRMAEVLKEGEPMPDVAHCMDVLGRMVMAECKNFDEADEARDRQGFQAKSLQHYLTGEAEPELRQRVVEVRRQMVQFLGAKRVAQFLRHRGRTPRKVEDLEDLARFMVRHLPKLKVPEVGGQQPDGAAWAKFLQPALEEVSGLLDEINSRQNAEHYGVRAKRAARLRFDKTFRLVLKICRALYELAGFERSAKSLRWRAGRPAEQKRLGNQEAV